MKTIYKVSARLDHIGMDMKVEKGEYVVLSKTYQNEETGDKIHRSYIGCVIKHNNVVSYDRYIFYSYCFIEDLSETIEKIHRSINEELNKHYQRMLKVKKNLDHFEVLGVGEQKKQMTNHHNIKVGDRLYYIDSNRNFSFDDIIPLYIERIEGNLFYASCLIGHLETLDEVYGKGKFFTKEEYAMREIYNKQCSRISVLFKERSGTISKEDYETVYSILHKYISVIP